MDRLSKGSSWNARHGKFAIIADRTWQYTRFGQPVPCRPRASRVLRRELEAYVGHGVSGRQWKRWYKQQRREEAAVRNVE